MSTSTDTIIVHSITSGATWYVSRRHADGTRSRDGFRADEGGDHPRRPLAVEEALEIGDRLGLRVEVWPVVGEPYAVPRT